MRDIQPYSQIRQNSDDEKKVENKTNIIELAKETGKLSSITILNMLLTTGNLFVSSIALSNLGKAGLNASGLITPSTLAILNSSTGILKSVGVLLGPLVKLKKFSDIGKYFQQGVLLSFLVSFPASAMCAILPSIFKAVHDDPDVVTIVGEFLYPYIINIPANILLTCFQDISLVLNDKKAVILSTLLAKVVGAILGYGMILGVFGMPKLGPSGFPYANGALLWATNILYLLYFRFNSKYHQCNLFFIPEYGKKKILRKLFSVGWPIGVMILIERSVLLSNAIMSKYMGDDALSAQEISMQYLFFMIVPMYGLSRGLGILTSKSKSLIDSKKIYKLGVGFSLIFSILIAIIYNSISLQLINAFSKHSLNHNTVKITQQLFIINSIGGIIDATRVATNGSLRGFKETKFSLKTTAFFMLSSLLISYLIGFTAELGVTGLYIGRNIGVFLCLGVLFLGISNRLNNYNFAFPPKFDAIRSCLFSGREEILDDDCKLDVAISFN